MNETCPKCGMNIRNAEFVHPSDILYHCGNLNVSGIYGFQLIQSEACKLIIELRQELWDEKMSNSAVPIKKWW